MRLIKSTALLLLLCSIALTAAEDWGLKKDSDGIQIFTRTVEGSKFKAVRGVTEMETSLASLVALVQDSAACPEWADLCKESRVEETLSAQEMYVYTHNDLPWPVKDRDVLAHVVWTQDPESRAVTMQSTATSDKLANTKGRVRLTEADARWIFTPLVNNKVEVVTEAHINPGGPLPAWITNMLLVDAPFKTLTNLRTLVKNPKYQNASVDFVTEAN
ncbi:MAG: START domain-containing protein [Pseudomonadales bacterium]